MSEFGFNTLSVHAGAQPDPATGARATPIYQTTSFVFEDADHAAALFNLQVFGNIYSRIMNPTNAVLEERIAALEGGRAGLAVASGHAAQMIVFHTLMHPGDEIVAARQLYGGSVNQFSQGFAKFGWHVKWADTRDPDSFRAALSPKTKAIFLESIANPGGAITDIEAVAGIAKNAGVPLVVDNTFATPYLIRPLEWGADIIVHSATKFLGGHGNSIAGLIVDGGKFDWGKSGKYPTLSEPCPSYHGMRLWETFGDMAFAIACRVLGLRDLGPALAPMNAFLVLTGIETLPLRMQRHCDNALAVARWLKQHPKVAWVSYAGLEDDPSHVLQRSYSPKGAGAVFTFGVKGGYEAGVALVNGVRLFSHLANVGDTRSLIIHPASTTHRQLSEEQKKAAGAGPEVVRLSIGIENVEDIIADLDQALGSI
ncbi:MAG TPA: O-acetylhomoserine aminocarboxypropyltransferase [Rhizomicrobium sp.]|jgi:O-acetylhomoserine (thiol)-lyase